MQTSVVVVVYDRHSGAIHDASAVIDNRHVGSSMLEAEDYASRLARKYPPEDYTIALCRPVQFVQAVLPDTPPPIIRKTVTENGEVLPIG